MNAPFVAALAGWKASTKNCLGWTHVPNNADVDGAESLRIAAAALEAMGIPRAGIHASSPANPGNDLEIAVRDDVALRLVARSSERVWSVVRGGLITHYAQYVHLQDIDALVLAEPSLRVTLGRDYIIRPDVTVGLVSGVLDAGVPFLHAAISCKWTIRSDRVQNIRHECTQMIRHRRGRLPHLVTVTAEPLPSRLVSIARGTGEVDAVYHVAFAAMEEAVAGVANIEQRAAWDEAVGQGRLRPYSELVETLATW